MKPSEVEREVELTISSLDKLKRADAPYYFVEKLLIEKSLRKIKKS